MDRVRDYANFTAWFAGLGYIAARPLLDPAHAPVLPPGFHIVGMLAAAFVCVRLICIFARRLMRRRTVTAPPPDPIAEAILNLSRRPPAPLSKVKPRAQFGLRNGPP